MLLLLLCLSPPRTRILKFAAREARYSVASFLDTFLYKQTFQFFFTQSSQMKTNLPNQLWYELVCLEGDLPVQYSASSTFQCSRVATVPWASSTQWSSVLGRVGATVNSAPQPQLYGRQLSSDYLQVSCIYTLTRCSLRWHTIIRMLL